MFLLGVISLTVDKMVLLHQTSGVSARMIKSLGNVSMTPESIDTTENTIAIYIHICLKIKPNSVRIRF